MTENTAEATTTDAASTDAPPDAPRAPQDAPHHEPEHDDADAKPGRDAARYRRQLRETESERDGLRERLDAAHRREVERLATDARLAAPADLWIGTDLADLLDEAGDVDAGKVGAALANLRAERPQWFHPLFGSADGGVRASTPSAPGFADAFAPRR